MAVEQLKDLVIRKFGKPVSSHYDSVQLQDAILKESGKRLSTQTIKRFFGLIKSSSRPDPSTLDAFSGYLKFSSYKDVYSWLSLSKTETAYPDHDWASEIVLHILKDIHPENIHEKGLLQLVKNLFILFERHPNLTSTIYPKLAASKFGRRYFFEQFVQYDALSSHYGMGLEHYLLHESERPSRFFGYSMLCMRDFLTGNDEGCRYYYQKVAEYNLEEVQTFHPFLVGRYYSSQVYMDCINSRHNDDFITATISSILSSNRHCDDLFETFPCTEMVFAEALIFTGHFAQAYELLNHKSVKEYKHPQHMDPAFKNHMNVLRIVSGLFAGKLSKDKVIKEVGKFDNSPTYFLCTNYNDFFVHLIKMKCGIQPRLHRANAKKCLADLGFNRLQFFFQLEA